MRSLIDIRELTVEEIDELNILEADLLAMRRAIDGLSVKADFANIDGNIARDFQIPAEAVVKGDAKSMLVAVIGVELFIKEAFASKVQLAIFINVQMVLVVSIAVVTACPVQVKFFDVALCFTGKLVQLLVSNWFGFLN